MSNPPCDSTASVVARKRKTTIQPFKPYSGCYIGKAEFRGEDMKMYSLFGMSAEAAGAEQKSP